MRSVLRRIVFNLEFEWTHPEEGITRHGPDSPLIPDKWKPKEEGVFTIQEIVDGPSEVLTPPSEARWLSMGLANENHKTYQPLSEQSVLHREFSEIPCSTLSPQAIEEFAGKYGLLGIGEVVGTESGILMIESASQWDSAIDSMRHAVQIWDSLNGVNLSGTQDPERFVNKSERGFWYQSPAISIDPEFEKKLEEYRQEYEDWGLVFFGDDNYIAGPHQHNKFLEDWQYRSDKRGPAKQYLVNIVNKHLIGNAVPQFHLGRHWGGHEEIVTSIAPRNLLGALWLQFFLEITRGNVRKCLMCKRPFIPQREDQVYCRLHGVGCRKKADRVRSEVFTDGRSRSQVAAKYGISSDDLDKILARRRTKQDHTSIA